MTVIVPRKRQEGAIIVLSLIMLLVMTTMGIGLWHVASREVDLVDIQVNRSETLHTAETCIDDAIRWLEVESASGPPCKAIGQGNLCKSIPDSGTQNMNADWRQTSGEKSKYRTRMGAHNFSCTITLRSTVSAGAGQKGTGGDVGQTNNYQGAISSTKYLYAVTSTGSGPDNVQSQVEIIASIISSL